MTKYCYLNNKILPISRARLKLNDIGILRAYGIFEYLWTYNGKIFLLHEHFVRLKCSAKLLNLKISVSEKQLEGIIKKLLVKNKFKESEIRIVLTGGPTPDAMTYNTPSFFILIEKIKYLPKIVYKKGAKLITCEHQREIPRAKTINYITAVQWQKQKNKQKALEILYTKNGYILEATTSNFFIFKKNTLITPKNNILIGTTRNFVIKLARKKFTIQQRNIRTSELNSATEAFITATNKEIVPVVKIDNKIIGVGKVGENTKYLMSLYYEYVKNF